MPPSPTSADTHAPRRHRYIPVRALAPRHHPRILAHLLALSPEDRHLRFGYPASDEQIERYVDRFDEDRDELFGIFNRRLQIIAMAHLAYGPPVQGAQNADMAEFGVSVLASARGHGMGARLFDTACLHARNRGVQRLFIHALSENTAMLRIARNAGASVERDGSESEAWLQLPPETVGSHLDEMVADQVAEIDYHFKRQASHVSLLWSVFREVTAHKTQVGEVAKE